jgi:hypothetical protein
LVWTSARDLALAISESMDRWASEVGVRGRRFRPIHARKTPYPLELALLGVCCASGAALRYAKALPSTSSTACAPSSSYLAPSLLRALE